MEQIQIIDSNKHAGETVRIGAWIANKRSSGRITFLQLRDETAFFQGVMFKPNSIEAFGKEVSTEKPQQIKHLSQETAVMVVGVIREDSHSKFGYEMDIIDLEAVGASEDYPITLREYGTDFLIDHCHLWLCSSKQHAIMLARNEIIRTTCEFFNEQGFVKTDNPILTGSAPEGATELFETDYFGQPAFLLQTGQSYAEAGAMASGKVFAFGPTFRVRKSKTRHHLTEFWMIEPEVAYTTHEESLDIQEVYVKRLIKSVLKSQQCPLDVLERSTALLEKYVSEPFKRIAYDDAIELLQKGEANNDYDHIEWGEDFDSPHETFISNYYGAPTFILNYPKAIRAFYMKPHPTRENVVICTGLTAPEGYGETISGSERATDYDYLKEKVAEFGLPEEEYSWYLGLRRYGPVPHSGFGLGLERAVTFITGNEHIRKAIPFPRMLNRIYP